MDGGPIFNAKAPAPPFENMGTILSIEKYLNELAVVNRLGRQRHHQKTNVNVTAGAIFNHNRQHTKNCLGLVHGSGPSLNIVLDL